MTTRMMKERFFLKKAYYESRLFMSGMNFGLFAATASTATATKHKMRGEEIESIVIIV